MPNQEQQDQEEKLKQILAQAIEVNSSDESLAKQDSDESLAKQDQDIETLFNKKFEEEKITESRETWEQLDKILRERSYKEFIKSNNDKQYTVKVALVIIKNIEKYTPNYVFSTPEARQFKARSGLAIS